MFSAVLIGLSLAVAAPVTKDAKKDAPSIVGEWDGIKALIGGMDMPVPKGGIGIAFAADGKATLREGDRAKAEEVTYAIDPKKSPAHIDLVPPAKEKEPTLFGIYKIEKDELTICMTMGGERPTKFESPAGSQIMLMTFKRAKKE